MEETAMQEKAICVIGYGKVPGDKLDDVRRELRREVQAALDDGYRTFLAEFKGVGLLFVQCVNEQREQYTDIFMEVAFDPKRNEPPICEEQELLSTCNGIWPLPKGSQEDYPLAVTRYLGGRSDRVIVVHGEELDDDTAYAMGYVQVMGPELRIVQA